MKMGKGFWLNPANGRWVEVVTHETAVHDRDMQKELGLTEQQVNMVDAVQGDADRVRITALKAGLIRLRDYPDGLHVEYIAPAWKKKAYKRALRRMIEDDRLADGRLNGISQAWEVKAVNLYEG